MGAIIAEIATKSQETTHGPSEIATMMTPYSLVVQLARLIPAPRKHAPVRPTLLAGRMRERFGCCPACREFIGIKVSTPTQRGIVCPACRQKVVSLEPLWPTLSETSFSRATSGDGSSHGGSKPARNALGRFVAFFRSKR
ncbi:hypothetical protein [Singulisphaera acidiphila]|uniref:Uncharacterized protein n=1 Tax=Singulisphaera acidiphila (strain ATCC BAA-1392 / DSM 18658 / VKM B-2454 / MOB10) TaxID=886293 RepID=L0D5V2_SINAD|nr:hypothetical protein [Singulisphaera acidiphila]AGA24637.1 hypothetical protein Sinac_0186 [Singulisphaera acidiphila DSM 18658]